MMNKYYSNNDKATVCYKNTCATVYGDTARLISIIAVVTVGLIAAAMLAKALK